MSSIGSVGSVGSSYTSSMMQSTRQRPDPTKLAEQLFSQLDTSGQGFIQKADLQTAFDKVAATAGSSPSTSSTSTSVDDIFTALDTDSNGKVSRQEFTDTLTKLQNDLDQQYQDSRVQTAIQAGGAERTGGRPPPPPPPSGGGPDMTKDELTSAVSQTSSSDSASKMMSNVLANFEAADTNGDGTVSFVEAMAYQQSSSSSGNASSNASTNASTNAVSSSSSGSSSEEKVMMQIMKLMQAYNIGIDPSQNNGLTSSLSVSA